MSSRWRSVLISAVILLLAGGAIAVAARSDGDHRGAAATSTTGSTTTTPSTTTSTTEPPTTTTTAPPVPWPAVPMDGVPRAVTTPTGVVLCSVVRDPSARVELPALARLMGQRVVSVEALDEGLAIRVEKIT
mgnify:CR=1 FL=1